MIVTSDSGPWRRFLQQPLDRRTGAAPAELVAHIAAVNASAGLAVDTRPAAVATDFLDDVQSAVDEMPASVKRRLDGVLLGVYFGTGIGSSAVTDVVVESTGKVVGLVVALDADAFLERGANAWATWKENSPFADGPHAIEAVIESPENDDRRHALQYLLLHEFGHVLSAGNVFLPDWWIGPDRFKPSEEYAFLSISWQIAMSNELIPLLREDFPLRSRIAYYGTPRLRNDDMLEVHATLEKTGFVSPYAAMNPYEDFAEAFASYVHVVLMNKSLAIRVQHEGLLIKTFEGYWSGARSSRKRALLAGLLGEA